MLLPATSATPPEGRRARIPLWAPALGTLLTAALAVRSTTWWQRPRTWAAVLAGTLLAMVVTWTLSAVSAWVGHILLRYQAKARLPYSPWQMAALAVWLVPIGVLIQSNSLWTAIPAMLLAGSLTTLLRRPPENGATTAGTPEFFGRALIPSGPRRAAAFAGSLTLQGGTVAASIGHAGEAAALFGATAALLTTQRDHGRRPLHPGAVVLLASVLTIFGLLQLWPGGGSDSLVPSSLRARTTSRTDTGDGRDRARDATPVDVTHLGVIVYPKRQKHVILVPPLPSLSADLFRHKDDPPLSIPFYGAYWLFRPPDLRPPPRSYVTEGTPTDLRLTSTGLLPLNMEARQNLGSFIDLNCCRRIDIAIQNADRYPSSVGLELILINTALPAAPELSLGVQPVTSTEPGGNGKDRAPVPETLSYAIPAERRFEKFDEFRTVFRLSPVRNSRSAMVAIDRFVLVPR